MEEKIFNNFSSLKVCIHLVLKMIFKKWLLNIFTAESLYAWETIFPPKKLLLVFYNLNLADMKNILPNYSKKYAHRFTLKKNDI